MSKEGGETAAQDGGTAEAGGKEPNASLYENRGSKKLIRVVTVLAYMFSVSFVAIVLSAYYLFLWQPPNPRLMHKLHMEESPQFEYFVADTPIIFSNHVGSEPDGSSRKNVLALEIPLRSEENSTAHGRTASPDSPNDFGQPRIILDKTTFGRGNAPKKSLSSLRNSLVHVLRDRRGNLSDLEELHRGSENTSHKSKRTIGQQNIHGTTSVRPLEESSEETATPSVFITGGKSILSKFIAVLRADWNRNEERPEDPTRESAEDRLENKSPPDIQLTVNVTDVADSSWNFRENPKTSSPAASISRRETKEDELRRDAEETQIETMTTKPPATSTVGQMERSERKSATMGSEDMTTILTRLMKMNPTPSTFSTTSKDVTAKATTTPENHNDTVQS